MKSQSKLVYDWRYLTRSEALEVLGIFACCRDNGVMIKNLDASFLNCLLCDEDGWIREDKDVDPLTGEWILDSRVNVHRNMFVGNVIHSLKSVTDNLFLMELPALEKINIFNEDQPGGFQIRARRGHALPQWPNLEKMFVQLDHCAESELCFLWEQTERPKLNKLCLNCSEHAWKVPFPRNLGNCCGNVKKLTVSCPWENPFFVSLWEGLPLLEDVTLDGCRKLTNKGFVGYGATGSRPAFLNLEKLKHLSINNLDAMPRITDAVFKNVFRYLKLISFRLSSEKVIRSISVGGIKELLTGPFAEAIEKLSLDRLKLEDVSKEQLKEVVSCFRCSKMI